MEKITTYLKTKPKISITTLLIILIFFKYIFPSSLIVFTPLIVGSLSPNVSYEKTEAVFDDMSKNLAERFSEVTKQSYLTGQKLSHISLPLRIFFYGIAWSTYIALISLVLYIIRIAIYYLMTNKKERMNNGNTK